MQPVTTGGIHVKVAAFEGPLDLLLHLIEEAQVDITDIPLAEIANQYFEALAMMQELEIDVASEYLVVAAQLLAIKSRKLLPEPSAASEEEVQAEEEQLQQLLLERLLQYRQFKKAAEALRQRENQQSLLHMREPHPQWPTADEPAIAQPLALKHTPEELQAVFLQVMQREVPQPPAPPAFFRPRRITVQEKLQQIVRRLRQREVATFWEFVPDRQRHDIVVTFLALLELLKQHRIEMRQQALFAEITVIWRVSSEARRQGAS